MLELLQVSTTMFEEDVFSQLGSGKHCYRNKLLPKQFEIDQETSDKSKNSIRLKI